MNAVRIAEHLDPAQFDLSVACFRDDGALRSRFAAAGVQIDVFPVRSLYGGSMMTQGIRFMRFLHREYVDVVHAHDWHTALLPIYLHSGLRGSENFRGAKRASNSKRA